MRYRHTGAVVTLLLMAVISLPGSARSQSEIRHSNQNECPLSVPSPGMTESAVVAANARLEPARGDQKVTIGTNLVNVAVTVSDSYGRLVTGFANEHFEVFDNNVKQQIAHFSYDDAPLSLGIVYDVSGSMDKHIDRSLHALKRFVETSHEDDDFFLITFNGRPRLVQNFTTSADELVSRLTLVRPDGATALYDAVYLAVEKLREGRHQKKALLIISDGQDNNSRYSFKELRGLVREADVQIYAIGTTGPMPGSLSRYGHMVLEELTEVSGGRAFFPDARHEAELTETCTRIALELRHQYSIGFYPTDTTGKGKLHQIKVRITPPKGSGRLLISYRRSYRPFKK